MATQSSPPMMMPPPTRNTHRSFTLPSRLDESKKPTASPSEKDIETLFESPRCKIVSFSPAQPIGRSRTVSLGASDQASPVGELPYGSNTERTIALGSLRVYLVPGSVAFLNSGKLVHPVLPKSACWCVDGKTKFVLGVPGKKYYRIELPCENDADQAKANDFKIVLARIAQYETTACPFKRGFYVELPEDIATPKRPWRPKHAPGINPFSPEGQQIVDGARVERRFHSPERQTSQSPRRVARLVKDSLGSDSESSLGSGNATRKSSLDHNVPKLIATYDEFGPTLQRPQTADPGDGRRRSVLSFDEVDAAHESDHSTGLRADVTDVVTEENVIEQAHQSVQVDHSIDRAAEDERVSVPGLMDTEPEISSEPSSSPASPFKKTTPPRLQFKDREEHNWLDGEDNEDTPTAAKQFSTMRSVTAPVFSPLRGDPFTIPDVQKIRPRLDSRESVASIESTSSFHSLHSPTSPVEHYEASGLDSLGISSSAAPAGSLNIHKQGISTNNITVSHERNVPDDLSTPTWPSFSPHEDEQEVDDDINTESDAKSFTTAISPGQSPPSFQEERQSRHSAPPIDRSTLRVGLHRRRAHSPMPAQANLYIPPSSISGHLTNLILHKTASLLLGPPVQLVALMLNLARRFAEGSLKGESYTLSASGQPIPCEWCDSDLDVSGESSEEDDYGISIGGTPEKRKQKQTQDGSRTRKSKDHIGGGSRSGNSSLRQRDATRRGGGGWDLD